MRQITSFFAIALLILTTANCFLSALSIAQTSLLWVKKIGGNCGGGYNAWAAYDGVAIDAAGNVFTAGGTTGGGSMCTAIRFEKYDANGNLLWSKIIESDACAFAIGSIATDGAGNVYITGYFTEAGTCTVDFNPDAGVNNLCWTNGPIFYAKYNSSGTYQWAKAVGYNSAMFAPTTDSKSIAIDGTGNVYIAGYFNTASSPATADFDPGAGTANLVSAGSADIFLAKYNSSGNYVWAVRDGGAGADQINAIALDASPNVFVTGSYNGSVYYAKYNSAGAQQWIKNLGGTGTGEGIDFDGSGNLYLSGYFSGTVDFDPGAGVVNLTSSGGNDIFFAKYDASGNYLWAKQIGSSNNDVSYDIDFAPSGNIFITGSFSGTVDFDPNAGTANLTSSSSSFFIAKYDASGNYIAAIAPMGTGASTSYSIAVDASDNAHIAGKYGTIDFDAGTCTNSLSGGSCANNWFVAKYCFGSVYGYCNCTAKYRSVTSGNWTNTATWEQSNDNVTWIAATSTPANPGSCGVQIQSGHTVSITTDITINSVTIDNGGILSYEGGIFTISGCGLLSINGSFIDSSSNDIVFGSGTNAGLWSFGSAGTLVKTTGTCSDCWKTAYSGGISTIPSTANWIIRKRGAADPKLSNGAPMYYPNLTIENYSGAVWNTTGSASSRFSGSYLFTNNAIIKGNLDIGGAGAEGVIFEDASIGGISTLPVIVQGNFYIRNGSEFYLSGNGINLQGNCTIDGSLTYGAANGRQLRFTGGNNQSITNSGTANIYAMRIDKTSNTLSLNSNIDVDNTLILTNKPVALNNFKLTVKNSATAAITRTNGYVVSESTSMNSILQWNIGTTTGSHIFPFGRADGTYIPFTLNLTAGDIGNVEGATFPTANNNEPVPPGVNNLNNATGLSCAGAVSLSVTNNNCNATVDRFWQIDKTGPSGTATITFSYGSSELAASPYNDPDNMVAQRYNISTNNWEPPLSGQASAAYTVTTPGVTAFSPWTITRSSSPLPIELISFTGYNAGNKNILEWSTATEINNDYFTVERSLSFGDGWAVVGTVKGAGNSSSKLYYQFTDTELPTTNHQLPTLFYRLKQTDFDGQYSYSNIIAITLKTEELAQVAIFPNPAENYIKCTIFPDNDTIAKIKIIDILGKIVLTRTESINKNQNYFTIDITSLNNGSYYLQITNLSGSSVIGKSFNKHK